MFFKIPRLRTRFELVFTVFVPDQSVGSVWLSSGFRVSAFLHVYTRAAGVWRFRVASTSWWIAVKGFKKDENRGCVFAYYTRAARALAMSVCVRASHNSAKQPNTRQRASVAWTCASTRVY